MKKEKNVFCRANIDPTKCSDWSTKDVYACVAPKKPRVCCKAMTASCLACSKGMTIDEFCQNNPNRYGCPDTCVQGADCGGQVWTDCGSACPLICGQPASEACIMLCKAEYQCNSKCFNEQTGQCENNVPSTLPPPPPTKPSTSLPVVQLSEKEIKQCRTKSLRTIYPRSVTGVLVMTTTDGTTLPCTMELARGPIRRALIQAFDDVPDSMVEVSCTSPVAGRRRLDASKPGFAWTIYTQEEDANKINSYAQKKQFTDAVVNNIQNDKHADVAEMSTVGKVNTIGDIEMENNDEEQEQEEDEKYSENAYDEDTEDKENDGKDDADQNKDTDLINEPTDQIGNDQITDQKQDEKDREKSPVIVLVGAVAGIASFVVVLGVLMYKVSRRRSSRNSVESFVVMSVVPGVAVMPTSIIVPNNELNIVPQIESVEWSKNIAARRPIGNYN